MMLEIILAENSEHACAKKEALTSFLKQHPSPTYEGICVYVYSDHLKLQDKQSRLAELDLNFSHCTLNPQSSSSLLWKALGKPCQNDVVFDLTSGFGTDALSLIDRGVSVVSCEKDPLIYMLLYLSVQSLKMIHPQIKWQVFCADAIDFVSEQTHLKLAYIDPFFHKKKKALPQNAMQWLKTISSVNTPNNTALFSSLEHQVERLVVKRPSKLPSPYPRKPNTTLTQKTTQYDVFLF